jgi:16S rRNA (adenine1518-N6/adenine1519-N6)-dimethyltransferase
MLVKPKKHLGQHFLMDETIAKNIVDALQVEAGFTKVLEIGPGMGVLTKYLIEKPQWETYVVDIDTESITWLEQHFPKLTGRIISADFLRMPLDKFFGNEQVAIIGNFPYNISSQIMFKVLECREQVPLVVGMFQKEVGERLAAGPGGRDYGILSVFLQAYYDIEYLFTVQPEVFNPAPKVKSGVIRCVRNSNKILGCNEKNFKHVVKTAFNQRRKTLRNALKSLMTHIDAATIPYLDLRAEALSWRQFVELTLLLFPE